MENYRFITIQVKLGETWGKNTKIIDNILTFYFSG